MSACSVLTMHGHDVDTVLDESLVGAPDRDVVAAAAAGNRLLITLDRGLGDIRAYPPGSHASIVVLRLADQSISSTIRALNGLAVNPRSPDAVRGRPRRSKEECSGSVGPEPALRGTPGSRANCVPRSSSPFRAAGRRADAPRLRRGLPSPGSPRSRVGKRASVWFGVGLRGVVRWLSRRGASGSMMLRFRIRRPRRLEEGPAPDVGGLLTEHLIGGGDRQMLPAVLVRGPVDPSRCSADNTGRAPSAAGIDGWGTAGSWRLPAQRECRAPKP